MREIISSFFTTDILTTVISVFGGIFIASLTYYLTKQKEREAEWQKEKLNFYVEFVSSITDTLECGHTLEGEKRFARACNNLHLFANTKVISALKEYQNEIRAGNTSRTIAGEEKALGNLIFQMREDMKIKHNNRDSFRTVRLWGFGTSNK